MRRQRLPNRRPAVTEEIIVGSARYTATIGFDPLGRPRELFLDGAKGGSDVAAILDDIGVAVSVALQHGVSAAAMAVSVGRAGSAAISVVGASLDALVRHELGG